MEARVKPTLREAAVGAAALMTMLSGCKEPEPLTPEQQRILAEVDEALEVMDAPCPTKPRPPFRKGPCCRFPTDARPDVHSALVRALVHIGKDGIPNRVQILDDSGTGFGEYTRDCLMAAEFLESAAPSLRVNHRYVR